MLIGEMMYTNKDAMTGERRWKHGVNKLIDMPSVDLSTSEETETEETVGRRSTGHDRHLVSRHRVDDWLV